MTPDVSSVEAVAEREGGCERWPSSCRCSACCFSYEALQQAAEQACYRDRLATLERIVAAGGDARNTYRMVKQLAALDEEIAVVNQLIAGSA